MSTHEGDDDEEEEEYLGVGVELKDKLLTRLATCNSFHKLYRLHFSGNGSMDLCSISQQANIESSNYDDGEDDDDGRDLI